MSGGVAFQLEISGLDAALSRIAATGRIDFQSLLDSLSRMGREQTRHRIEVEHRWPSGFPWQKTLDGRAALFVSGQHLWRSIDHAVIGDAAVWGSGWIGARIHQFGGVITPKNGKALKFWWVEKGWTNFAVVKKVTMPKRPYLGISSENARDLEELALARLARMGGLQ